MIPRDRAPLPELVIHRCYARATAKSLSGTCVILAAHIFLNTLLLTVPLPFYTITASLSSGGLMTEHIPCDICRIPSTKTISYISGSGRRIGLTLCTEHSREFWDKLAIPHRETAIIKPTPHQPFPRASCIV